MENTRFDGLAKEISRSRSRRQVLRGLSVGSGIGALTLLGVKAEAQAGSICLQRGDPCGSDTDCCGDLRCPISIGLCHQPEGKGRRRRV